MLNVMTTESIYVSDIVWDVDDPEELELPHEVDIPWTGDFELENVTLAELNQVEQCVEDYLSDEYGFCVIAYSWDI